MLNLRTPLLIAALLASCAAPPTTDDTQEPEPLELVRDWPTRPHPAFSAWLDEELPEETVRPLTPAGMEELTQALEDEGERAVRAALVLGRSRTREAGDVLLARLERRVLSKERSGDAGDVVAAFALANHPRSRKLASNLRDLAIGADPHPDLEVRIECAVAALANGQDDVTPLLLRSLYIGTWRGRDLSREFEESPTTAWIRGRAAQALSDRAGVEVTYHYDAPLADRELEADLLAALLGLEPPN